MRGVVMEEMLHMVSAANVLNAIGGALRTKNEKQHRHTRASHPGGIAMNS